MLALCRVRRLAFSSFPSPDGRPLDGTSEEYSPCLSFSGIELNGPLFFLLCSPLQATCVSFKLPSPDGALLFLINPSRNYQKCLCFLWVLYNDFLRLSRRGKSAPLLTDTSFPRTISGRDAPLRGLYLILFDSLFECGLARARERALLPAVLRSWACLAGFTLPHRRALFFLSSLRLFLSGIEKALQRGHPLILLASGLSATAIPFSLPFPVHGACVPKIAVSRTTV